MYMILMDQLAKNKRKEKTSSKSGVYRSDVYEEMSVEPFNDHIEYGTGNFLNGKLFFEIPVNS